MDETEEDEISEPEEDSLAGQMSALKGGAAAPPKKRKTPVKEEESSGSDTEGDVDDESDETNTVSPFPPKISLSVTTGVTSYVLLYIVRCHCHLVVISRTSTLYRDRIYADRHCSLGH